jgi:thiol-disulfide isomerase/thioredoxin
LKKIILLTVLLATIFSAFIFNPATAAPSRGKEEIKTTIYFFWGEGCPYCEQQKKFFIHLKKKHPEVKIKSYEVTKNAANRPIFHLLARSYDMTARSVPMTFIDNFKPVRGFNMELARHIEDMVEYCRNDYCVDPGVKAGLISAPEDAPPISEELRQWPHANEGEIINLPLLGRVNLAEMPLFLMTGIVAFVDGFNPCSLWLITLLLGIVIPSGSRRKALVVSLTFLLVTAGAYGMFILGLLHAFYYIGFMFWIRLMVAVVAFIFAVVNIKDYFWFKKGISFTIPEEYQPKIFKKFHSLATSKESHPHLIASVAAMALGAVLIELPCTAGLPIIWSGIISQYSISLPLFILLFLLYLFVYLLLELIIIFLAIITLKSTRLQKIHGRILKLIGGLIMLALAGVMLLAPDTMETFQGVLTVFVGSFGAASIIIIIDRIILPRLGNEPDR